MVQTAYVREIQDSKPGVVRTFSEMDQGMGLEQ